jgi:hypothetical protein
MKESMLGVRTNGYSGNFSRPLTNFPVDVDFLLS